MACDHNETIAKAPRRGGGRLPEKGACLGAADLVLFALGAAAFLGAAGAMEADCCRRLKVGVEAEKVGRSLRRRNALR